MRLPARLMLAATLFLATCQGTPLYAEEPIVPPVGSSAAKPRLPLTLLIDAVEFASRSSGLKPVDPASIPIHFKSSKWLHQVYFGAAYKDGMEDNPAFRIRAMQESGSIFLAEDFDAERDAHVLVHELVHALQYAAGQFDDGTFHCAKESEWKAYAAGDLWLIATGRSEEVTPPIWAYMLSSCPPPHLIGR